MTELEKMQEIARSSPVETSSMVTHSRFGGPGWWVAIGTLIGVIAILALAVFMTFRSAQANEDRQRDRDQESQEIQDVAGINKQILEELRAALLESPGNTQRAILALINDNRRIHGCKTVPRIEDLATGPTCSVVRPAPAPPRQPSPAPTTTTTAPPPSPPPPPPTEMPDTG